MLELDTIIQHDVSKPFPLPDECIDCVITSPPFWGLRDYKGAETVWGGNPKCNHAFNIKTKDIQSSKNKDFNKRYHGYTGDGRKQEDSQQITITSGFCPKCNAWYGQLGLERYYYTYIEHLVMVCREIKRVLKKSGSFYLNLGDTFYGSAQGYGASKKSKTGFQDVTKGYYAASKQKPPMLYKWPDKWLKPKQLMLIPSRVAIALQEDGWILRADIIWRKPNPLPSSVKDRVNTTYEHVFHFVRSRKYYFDLDAIREPHKWGNDQVRLSTPKKFGGIGLPERMGQANRDGRIIKVNPKGRNPGNVIDYDLSKECGLPTTGPKARSNLPSQDQHRQGSTLGTIHPKGCNPGDVLLTNRECSLMEFFNQRGSGGNPGHGVQGSTLGTTHPKGGNPGDTFDWGSHDLNKKGKPRVSTLWKSGGVPRTTHPLGKGQGDFWEICTKPFTGYNPDLEHFSVFPEELLLKPLKSSCSKQVCKKCGKPRMRIHKKGNLVFGDGHRKLIKREKIDDSGKDAWAGVGQMGERVIPGAYYENETSGWTKCKCNVGFEPGVVLDPFCGRGTTGKVAKNLGLHYILFDIKPEYCELARLFIGGQKYKILKGQSSLDSFSGGQ